MGKKPHNGKSRRYHSKKAILEEVHKELTPLAGSFAGTNHYFQLIGICDIQASLDPTTWAPAYAVALNTHHYAVLKSLKVNLELHSLSLSTNTDPAFKVGVALVTTPKQIALPGTPEYVDSTWDLDVAFASIMTNEYCVVKNKEQTMKFIGYAGSPASDVTRTSLNWNVPGPFIDQMEYKESPILRQYLYIYALMGANFTSKATVFYTGTVERKLALRPIKTGQMIRRW
jgi:hypothetical protein